MLRTYVDIVAFSIISAGVGTLILLPANRLTILILMLPLKVALLTWMAIMLEWSLFDIVLGLIKITPGVAFARDDNGRIPLHMLYDSCPRNDMSMLKLVLKFNLGVALCRKCKGAYTTSVAVQTTEGSFSGSGGISG